MPKLVAQVSYPNLSKTDSESRPDLQPVAIEQSAVWMFGGVLGLLLLGMVTLGKVGVKRSTFVGVMGFIMLVCLALMLIIVAICAFR